MSLKIVVGGQFAKQEIKAYLEQQGNAFEVTVKSDLEAAMAMKRGEHDFYIGACDTGSGGALAMAIALLGKNRCATISTPTTAMSYEEILREFQSGKVAYGFTKNSLEHMLPLLTKALLEYGGQ